MTQHAGSSDSGAHEPPPQPLSALDRTKLADLERNTKLIFGPPRPSVGPGEAILLCTMKNGELYLNSFMAHYRTLGIRRFVFLDNGSTDRSVEMLRAQEGVSLFRTELPYSTYYHAVNQFLLEQHGGTSWCLLVDIDELFDFPLSSSLTFSSFLRYLDAHDYSAVTTQLLEMFSETPLRALVSTPHDSIKELYRFCDLSNLEKHYTIPDDRSGEYSGSNIFSNPAIQTMLGGIRKKIFGLNTVMLTKHSLMRHSSTQTLVNPHFTTGARIADVSCVLRHYKFLGSFISYVRESVANNSHWNDSSEYRAYEKTLEANPDLTLHTSSAMLLSNTDELIKEGFIVVSDAYLKWVETNGRTCARDEVGTPRIGDSYRAPGACGSDAPLAHARAS